MYSRKRGASSWLTGLAACAGAWCANADAAVTFHIDQLEPIAITESTQAQSRGTAARTRIRFNADSRPIELVLEPNTGLLPGGNRVGESETLRGQVAGVASSWARVTRNRGVYQGLFFDGARHYVIDSAAALARGSAQAAALDPAATVVYRLSDLQIEGALFEGDTLQTARTGTQALADLAAGVTPQVAMAVLATRRLNVGVIADAELAAQDAGDVALVKSKINARMNIVEGIFSQQLGVQISLLEPTVLTGASQPFSSNVPKTLLEELKTYRSETALQQSTGLTHLMTGRNLDGDTVGIAYTSSVCDRAFAASVSEAGKDNFLDALITAHEMGHAFGAPHDGDAAEACAATSLDFLMAPKLLRSNSSFSDCSLTQMSKYLATASCLAPVDAADAALGAPLTTALALDQPTTIAISVHSNGNIAVNDVKLSITLPANVDAAGVGVSSGSCTIRPGLVECVLGSLAPGQMIDAQVSLIGRARGNAAADVLVTASNDRLAQNNMTQIRLETQPGSDLMVKAVGTPLALKVNDTSSVTITLQNSGLAAAPDSRFAATFPAGLVPTTLSATGISCSLAGDSIQCADTNFEAGATATLTLGLRATTAGEQRLRLAFNSATRPDPQPGNNDATLTFTVAAVVTAPPPATSSGSSGGGGGLGLDLLVVLALLQASRFVQRRARTASLKGTCRI